MQQALALPNLVARGDSFQGEVTKFSLEVLSVLALRGIRLQPGQAQVNAIVFDRRRGRDGVWQAGNRLAFEGNIRGG